LVAAAALGGLRAPRGVDGAEARRSRALAWAAASGALVLDDFVTGPHAVVLTSGNDLSYQSDSAIAGGVRQTWFEFSGYPDHPGSFSVGDYRGLIVGTGVDGFHRLEVAYGYSSGGAVNPMGLDLSGYAELVLDVAWSDARLNVNVLLFTGTGYSQHGVELAPGSDVGHRVPLDSAVLGGAADLRQIDHIVLVVQSASARGANDYAIRGLRVE
jgi:hypothetical protein